MALTPKQSRFVEEYLKDLNGTQAATRAGYSAKGAEVTASKLLSNPKVARVVQETLARRAARVEVKTDDILRELMRLAMTDLGQAFKEDGTLKKVHDMPEDVRRAISSIEVDEYFEGGSGEEFSAGKVRKIKFWDKPKTLELLGKHLKMWTDKLEVSADSSFAELLKAARERARSR